MKKLLFLAMVLLPIAGCSTKNEVQKPIEDAKPILLTPAQQKRVGQDNAFSFELMKRTLEKSDEDKKKKRSKKHSVKHQDLRICVNELSQNCSETP